MGIKITQKTKNSSNEAFISSNEKKAVQKIIFQMSKNIVQMSKKEIIQMNQKKVQLSKTLNNSLNKQKK